MNHFELMPQDWYKRRTPKEKRRDVDVFSIDGFEKKDGHFCTMYVTFTNGEFEKMNARVCINETYEIQPDGSVITKYNHCSVQGITPWGDSVIVKLIE